MIGPELTTRSVFALPAIWSIDTFGRRNLLLFGLPCMGLMLFWAGSMFFMNPDNAARVPVLALGMYRGVRVCVTNVLILAIYLFTAFYSPTIGPVPL